MRPVWFHCLREASDETKGVHFLARRGAAQVLPGSAWISLPAEDEIISSEALYA